MASGRTGAKRTNPIRRIARDLYHTALKRARQRGYEFSLTIDWIVAKLRAGRCEATGIPFSTGGSRFRSPWTPSLDRRDPSQGYTPNNTQVVVLIHNNARGAWGDDFLHIYIRHMARRIW